VCNDKSTAHLSSTPVVQMTLQTQTVPSAPCLRGCQSVSSDIFRHCQCTQTHSDTVSVLRHIQTLPVCVLRHIQTLSVYSDTFRHCQCSQTYSDTVSVLRHIQTLPVCPQTYSDTASLCSQAYSDTVCVLRHIQTLSVWVLRHIQTLSVCVLRHNQTLSVCVLRHNQTLSVCVLRHNQTLSVFVLRHNQTLSVCVLRHILLLYFPEYDEVSRSYKTTGNMTVLCILMSVFLDSRQEKRIFSSVVGIMYRGKDYPAVINMYSTCSGPT